MRMVLHNVSTDLYLQDVGRWTADPRRALTVQNPGQALDLGRRTGFKDLEIILSSSVVPCDVRMPLAHIGGETLDGERLDNAA